MSVTNSLGDFLLNTVVLRKPLEFTDGTIQTTAYLGGSGGEDLSTVLTNGNNAGNQNITNLNNIGMNGLVTQNNLVVSATQNVLDGTVIATNNGVTSTPSLDVVDGSKSMYFIPNSTAGSFNPSISAGNETILAKGAGTGTETLGLTTWSSTNSAVKVAPTSVSIGAGGTSATPTVGTTYNATAGKMVSNVTAGAVISCPDISPTPTLALNETSSNQSIYFIPKSGAGNYNPLDTAGAQEIVATANGVSNLSTFSIVPHSSTCCGLRISGVTANPYAEIGCGGTAVDPTNRITFKSTGTQEYGQSHQFVNGVAQYDAAGQTERIIPSAPSINATTVPSFEFKSFNLGGDAGTVSHVINLSHNVTNTTNYAVFPSVYYGFSGTAGTYNALGTSGALRPIVISSITSSNFTFNLEKQTSDNVNIYITFLIVYNVANTNYPKSY